MFLLEAFMSYNMYHGDKDKKKQQIVVKIGVIKILRGAIHPGWEKSLFFHKMEMPTRTKHNTGQYRPP